MLTLKAFFLLRVRRDYSWMNNEAIWSWEKA